MRTCHVDGLRARRACSVGADHRYARPAERLRKCRAGDIAWIAVAHRVPAHHEPHVLPFETRFGESVVGSFNAVFDEVSAPLAPRVHATTEDGDLLRHRGFLARAH